VNFDESRSKKAGIDFSRMHVSRETTIFYLVFTTLLMAMTYGCWWQWHRRATGEAEKELVTRTNSMEPEKGLLRAATSAGSRPPGDPRRLGGTPQSPLQTPLQTSLLSPPQSPLLGSPQSPPPTPMTPVLMSPTPAKSRSTWH